MKGLRSLLLALTFAGSLKAEVEVLPPDFTLFGKPAGDFAADLYRYVYPLSTNMDYLFPKAGSLDDERVYFLARPIFPGTQPGIPTFFVPDDAYVFFPIYAVVWDNVDSCPPCFTIEQLRDIARVYVDAVTAVHATIDGVLLPDLLSHRTQSAVFSVYFDNPDNFASLLSGHPFVGWDDPMVADGYFLMLKPLSAGIHDFRTGGIIGEPNGFPFERHYQIHSLSQPEWLARQTDQLAETIRTSSLDEIRSRPLLASLKASQDSFISGHLQAGAHRLRAFQNKVRAQIASIDSALVETLSQSAQRAIDRATAQLANPSTTK